MLRTLAVSAGLLALAACVPAPVPDSGRGVGFNDYAEYELQRARREAALRGSGSTAFPQAAAGAPVTAVQTTPAISSSELAAAGIGGSAATAPAQGGAPLSALNPAATRVPGLEASPTNPPPVSANNPGISDEQSFDAVASRETIESDAQRRAAQAAARQVIEPSALPVRPSDTGPNIVQYAINAPNVRGEALYSRSVLSGQGRFQRNCASYNTPDDAQRDFLARGGPERDPRGIDPDGDGFACGWDPAPFKLARGN